MERRDGGMWLKAEWGILFVMAGIYAALTYLVPVAVDDYMYINRWDGASAGGGSFFDTLVHFLKNNRAIDNFRIANMLAPLFLLAEPFKALFPALNGVMLALTAWLCSRAALYGSPTGGRNRCLVLMAVWALMIIFMPWRWIFVLDFSLNYIWAAAINLLFIFSAIRLLRPDATTGWFVVGILLAMVAGGWHESFALPTLLGLCIFILAKGFKTVPPRFYAVVGLFTVSTLFFGLSPGIINRARGILNEPAGIESLWSCAILAILSAALAALLLTPGGRRTLGEISRTPTFCIALGVAAGGSAIGWLTEITARSFFWADLAAIVLLVYVGVRAIRVRSASAATVAMALTGLFCLGQSALVITAQAKLRRVDDEIVRLMEQSDTGTVYYDYPLADDVSPLCFEMPVYGVWRLPWHYLVIKDHLGKPYAGMAPASLRGAYLVERNPIAETPEFFESRGHLFSAPEALLIDGRMVPIPIRVNLRFGYADGREENLDALAHPYVSGADTLWYYDRVPSDLSAARRVTLRVL